MTTYSRHVRKIHSADDSLCLNTLRNDVWHFGYGGFPYDKCSYSSKNRRTHIIERMEFFDSNYFDDRSMYETYDLKNIFQI